MSRYRALDQQQVAFRINTYNDQALRCSANVAQMTGHLLTFENAPGRLVLTDRSGDAMRPRVTVGRVLHMEVVALDGTGKALTDRGTDDINFLADFKRRNINLGTNLKLADISLVQAEFGDLVAGFNLPLVAWTRAMASGYRK